MLRSSKEGRKQAARYHAFPSGHPAFTSRNSSSSQFSAASSSIQPQNRPIAPKSYLNPANKSSSLRQSTVESDFESDSSSSLSVMDDGDDSTNGNSSNTTMQGIVMAEDCANGRFILGIVDAGDNELPGKVVEDDSASAMPPFHLRASPSRETIEEQSQSVSQYNSSPLSSPPTSHPDEEDIIDGIAVNVEKWNERVATPEGSDDGFLIERWTVRGEPFEPASAQLQDEDGKNTPKSSRQDQKRLEPRSVEGDSMVDSRSPRVKVKSLRQKEAEETQSLSPASKRRLQAQRAEMTANTSRQSMPHSEEEVEELSRDSTLSEESITTAPNDKANESVSLDSNTTIRRGRGRPLGSTKQKAIERLASERSYSTSASITPVASADKEGPDVELGSSADSATRRRQSSRKSLSKKDALSYLNLVQAQFPEQPDLYNRFLDIMMDFKDQSIKTSDVVERALTLFKDRPALIQGFNQFLPDYYRIECSLTADGRNLITVTTPSSTRTILSGEDKKVKAKSKSKKSDSSLPAASATQRRSTRQSDGTEVVASASKAVEKFEKPVRTRASLLKPRESTAAGSTRKAPEVNKANRRSINIDEARTNSAGPSIESTVDDGTEAGSKQVRPAWKRKTYLTSGLYSDDFKKDESKESHRRKSAKDIPESLARGTSRTRKANQKSALPLPVDYGLALLEQQRDFRLPYPIAQKMQDIRDKLESKKKPPPYKHIAQNQYFSRTKLGGEIMICHCPSDGDCGDSCVNRLTECLCHPKHCPCGDRCTNIYFGKRKAVKTEVQWYGARGFGLKTLEPIKKGGFIDEYRGEVIDFNEAVRRIKDHYKDTGNYYFLMYDAPAGEMLDGGLKGNITRFANHSCDPNCKVQKWIVNGSGEMLSDEYQVALFAERDIEAGEELTYDYGWSAFAAKAVSGESNSATPEVCHCGAAKCTGFLGVKKSSASVASEVVSKVLKRAHRKKAKKIVESCKSSVVSSAAASPSKPSSTVKSTSPTKISFASPTKKSYASPSKTTPAKLNRRGLMGQVLDGLISPGSTLTSLSGSSDDDASELGKSTDSILSTLSSLDSEPFRRGKRLLSHSNTPHISVEPRSETSLGKRKRVSARGSSPVEISSRSSTSAKVAQKTGRILLKDRVIRVLVPNDEDESPEPDLIVEGKRDRKMSLKAMEFDNVPSEKYYNKRRAVSSSSNGIVEARRGISADNFTPLKKSALEKQARSSPTTQIRLTSRARDLYDGLVNAQGRTFNIKDYPRGIIFYDRNGNQLDFDEHRMRTNNDKGTTVYTKQELSSSMLKEWEALEPKKRKGSSERRNHP